MTVWGIELCTKNLYKIGSMYVHMYMRNQDQDTAFNIYLDQMGTEFNKYKF